MKLSGTPTFIRLALTVMVLTAAAATAGCSSNQATDIQNNEVATDVADDVAVADEAPIDTSRDAVAADAHDAAEIVADTTADTESDTATHDAEIIDIIADGDAADAVDARDVPPPPLWENIAPVGINTIDNTIGVSTHMEQSVGENAHRDFEFEKYAELGSVTIREDYHWHRIEPTDDQWTFSNVQGQVDQAMENGVRIMPMFGYNLDWAMTEPGNYSSIIWAEYGEYVGKVAETYCDYIKEYEIWNEENIPRFWAPKPDPEAYGNMLKAAYEGIKTACPDARVSFGGMASYDAETDLSDRFGFLKRVWQAHPDLCDYFDIVAYHPYTFLQYYPPEYDEIVDESLQFQSQTGQTDIIRGILTEMGCPDKDLWITEQGFPSFGQTEEKIGEFVPRSLILAARDNVEKWMWYTFWDGYPTTEGIRPHEAYFGLFGWPGEDGTVRRAKPAWYALKAAADIIGDKRFARDISAALGLPNDVYALVFMTDTRDMTVVAWDGRDFPDVSWGTAGPGGLNTTFEMTMPLPVGYTNATIFDINGIQITEGFQIQENAGVSTLTLTLTPAVKYISLPLPDA